VGGLVPALLGPELPDWVPDVARGADRVVLLVLDGLGAAAVRDHGARLPVLAGMAGGTITTVAPTTTSAALTSIATGATPAAHGVVGYRMRVGGRVLNVLRWQVGDREAAPEPASVQPLPPFLGHRVPVVTRSEFEKTGFTAAHLRGADFLGWRTTSALLELVRRSVDGGARFTYAYYDGVDKVAHEHGLASDVYATELVLTDRLVDDLLDRLPDDTCLLVTADHGQVEVGPEGAVPLNDIERLVATYSGEGRFRTLYARTGATRDLLEACADRYGDRAWVLSRDRLFDEGYLGPDGGLSARSRVGDVVLAAHAPVIFADPGQQKETRMRAQHGSLTADEVEVPLRAARGRR
jgi:predicted AlkP superfamily pyrophosphatase or phosphodiesterase